MKAAAAPKAVEKELAVRVIDADCHPTLTLEDLAERLEEPWRSRYGRAHFSEVETMGAIYFPPAGGVRGDSLPAAGGVPGSDPGFFDQQLLHDAGIDFAMLLALQPRAKPGQPEFETALCSAHNRWLTDTWLGGYNWHGRYRGSIRVCPYDTSGAVREIETWAGHPYVSQVYILPEASAPFGDDRYFPVFEAAARQGLAVGLHVIRTPGMQVLTPVGHPSYRVEIFAQWPLYFMSHLASLIFGGTFDRLPSLRIVCIESGFSWIAPFMWRLDNRWRALRSEVPHVKRPPSDYIRQHVRLTTQPFEQPRREGAMNQLLQWMGAEDLLMFATDYPHHDFDDPGWVRPRLPKAIREAVMFRNAQEFYGLPATRPRDRLDDADAP